MLRESFKKYTFSHTLSNRKHVPIWYWNNIEKLRSPLGQCEPVLEIRLCNLILTESTDYNHIDHDSNRVRYNNYPFMQLNQRFSFFVRSIYPIS